MLIAKKKKIKILWRLSWLQGWPRRLAHAKDSKKWKGYKNGSLPNLSKM